MYTWGTGGYGELGNKGLDYSNIPNHITSTKCALVAKVQCGPTYTAFIDYNGCVLYFGRILEKRQVRSSLPYVINSGKIYRENTITNYVNDSQSDFNVRHIENITASDFSSGVNLIAIIDLTGNLFIYNEEENLCKVKVNKPVSCVKFIYSNFYAISKDKDTVCEFVQKGPNFSFVNFNEKTYTIDKDFSQSISLIELPYYAHLLFFLIECSPQKKHEVENKEKRIFTLIRNKKIHQTEKFNTDDESNTSLFKDSLCDRSDISRISKYSQSVTKRMGNLSMQNSNIEDVSVLPPNSVKSKNRLNRDYSQQSERSSRLSCNNSRISKISDLLGKIFNRKLSQIDTLNHHVVNPSADKKLIDIERLVNVVPVNRKYEITRKNEKESSLSKININEKDIPITGNMLSPPVETIKNKLVEKKFFLSPETNCLDNKYKSNMSSVNEYKRIVKKLNFNNAVENEPETKANKSNIIKLDFSKIKKANDFGSNNNSKIESPSLSMSIKNESLPKTGFDRNSIKICAITDNTINLNLKNQKKQSIVNNTTIDRMELSIISNREQIHDRDFNMNSNGKSNKNKNQNVTYSCDVSHVSNGKPDVNSNTEEISEQNSEMLNITNKERENESSIQNIVSESFNIQIKEIFYDENLNIGTFACGKDLATNLALIPGDYHKTNNEFNRFKRNKHNHYMIPKPENNISEAEEKNCLNQFEHDGFKSTKVKGNVEIPLLDLEVLKNDKTNGNNFEMIFPEKSNEYVADRNINNQTYTYTVSDNLNNNVIQQMSEKIKLRDTMLHNKNMSVQSSNGNFNSRDEANGHKQVENFAPDTINDDISNNKLDSKTTIDCVDPSNTVTTAVLNKIYPKSEETIQITQLYKRKSSITSFKTAKKDPQSNFNSMNEMKGIIVSNRDKYFLSNNINGNVNLKVPEVEDINASNSNISGSPPQFIIKNILEVKNLNTKISPSVNPIEIQKDNESNTEEKQLSQCLSISNLSQEITKFKLGNEINQFKLSYDANNNDNNSINISVFNKATSTNSSAYSENNFITQKNSDNNVANLKSIMIKTSSANKTSPKVVKVAQNIENSNSNIIYNHYNTQNYKIPYIDPIIEEEAYKENSFLSFYNPNNNSEEKSKIENINLDKSLNQNKILIKDFIHSNSNNDDITTINLKSESDLVRNTSLNNISQYILDSSRIKENKKVFSSNKLQLNTITSIIQNSKKNSAVISPNMSSSFFTKMKDTTTPITSNHEDKNTYTNDNLSQDKKRTELNRQSNQTDIKGIRNIKISPNIPAIGVANSNRIISNSNTNYRGSTNNKKIIHNVSGLNNKNTKDSNIQNISNLNNTNNNMNNVTDNLSSINDSNLNETDSRINPGGPDKKLEKSNTHKILTLKIKQDLRNKNSPKQININYLRSPDPVDINSNFSKTGSNFNKRNINEKSRKSSILSRVKAGTQSQNTNKNNRNSITEFRPKNLNDRKESKTNEIQSEMYTSNINSDKKSEYNQSIITPKKMSNANLSTNSNSKLNKNYSVKDLNKIFSPKNRDSLSNMYISDKEVETNTTKYPKARSVVNIKHSRNHKEQSTLNEQPNMNNDSNKTIKISHFNFKNSENNTRYSDANQEQDNELMTKFLKDLYHNYKENEEINKNENFEEYIKKIITNQETGHSLQSKQDNNQRGRLLTTKSEELDNSDSPKTPINEERIKSYLRNKFRDGNISPKLTFCLTPTKFMKDDDYKDRTNIFEPLELDRSGLTQRSINLSYRKSSSVPHTTNSFDFSNSSSPKKFFISNDTINNIHPFNIIDDKDLRYNNRILVKRGTFSYVSNEGCQTFKLNSIRENAVENESSPMKHSNELDHDDCRKYMIDHHTR